jgi:hypothetical protein
MISKTQDKAADGMRRAIALLTYEAEWAWFQKTQAHIVVQEAVKHCGTQAALAARAGVTRTSVSEGMKPGSIIKPKTFLRIVAAVYPMEARLIEAELKDIERMKG